MDQIETLFNGYPFLNPYNRIKGEAVELPVSRLVRVGAVIIVRRYLLENWIIHQPPLTESLQQFQKNCELVAKPSLAQEMLDPQALSSEL